VASPSAPSIRAPTSGLSRSSGESRVPVLTQSGARSRVGLRDGVGKPSGRARCGRQPAESCSSGRGSLFSCAAWPIWVTTRCEPRTKPRLPGRAASKTCREDQVVCMVCEATHRGSIDRSITVGLIETGRGSPRAWFHSWRDGISLDLVGERALVWCRPALLLAHRGLKVIGCLWFDVGWSWPPAYSLSPS
jgi:hypothetical protein